MYHNSKISLQFDQFQNDNANIVFLCQCLSLLFCDHEYAFYPPLLFTSLLNIISYTFVQLALVGSQIFRQR